MKKISCLALVVVFGVSMALAQTQLGFKVIPSISSNRPHTNADTLEISQHNTAFRVGMGLVVDIPLSEFYFLHTGINFMPKYLSLTTTDLESQQSSTETFKANYLQIPFGLKLYTNEISEGFQMHFKVGTSLDIKISEIKEKKGQGWIKDMNDLDMTMHLGLGGKKKLGENTAVFGSFVYYYGLFNAINSTIPVQSKIVSKLDMMAFEIGIMF